MATDKQLEDMFNKNQDINPQDGYYSDDQLPEDRTITNDYFGECINFLPKNQGYSIHSQAKTSDAELDALTTLIDNHAAGIKKYKHDSKKLNELNRDFSKEYSRITGMNYK